MKHTVLTLLLVIGIVILTKAQADSVKGPLTISGYLETYYLYDFSNPDDHNRPEFVYSFNRHNEVNINLGYLQAAYESDRVRAKLALMTGTYANANLAAEPGVLKNIFEANAGVRLSRSRELWMDAGICASHIGFESAIGSGCWNMTRSMLADNSPYYESGVKVSYSSPSGEWFISGLIVNGWQRIQRVDGNQTPAFGHQLTWTPTDRITLNSSSFIGSDTPDSEQLMRYFHNFYGIFKINEQLGLILGLDLGMQQSAETDNDYDNWFSPILIARYALTDKFRVAVRAEYFEDTQGVIVASATPNGFQTLGYSMNFDVQVTDDVLWRTEVRTLSSREDNPFTDADENPVANNSFVGTSLCIAF